MKPLSASLDIQELVLSWYFKTDKNTELNSVKLVYSLACRHKHDYILQQYTVVFSK